MALKYSVIAVSGFGCPFGPCDVRGGDGGGGGRVVVGLAGDVCEQSGDVCEQCPCRMMSRPELLLGEMFVILCSHVVRGTCVQGQVQQQCITFVVAGTGKMSNIKINLWSSCAHRHYYCRVSDPRNAITKVIFFVVLFQIRQL